MVSAGDMEAAFGDRAFTAHDVTNVVAIKPTAYAPSANDAPRTVTVVAAVAADPIIAAPIVTGSRGATAQIDRLVVPSSSFFRGVIL
jgi:hypothetical protein